MQQANKPLKCQDIKKMFNEIALTSSVGAIFVKMSTTSSVKKLMLQEFIAEAMLLASVWRRLNEITTLLARFGSSRHVLDLHYSIQGNRMWKWQHNHKRTFSLQHQLALLQDSSWTISAGAPCLQLWHHPQHLSKCCFHTCLLTMAVGTKKKGRELAKAAKSSKA